MAPLDFGPYLCPLNSSSFMSLQAWIHPGGPHITRKAEAMQQHHGRTLAADSDVEAGAVRRNHLRVKARRKRRDFRHEGR